ncbi:hypothetical protein GP5015_1578 [gamma proteobacterium HTCC5015]|nr:hypothetical protein GP5015_1578 [gamma proteobacterium HTCC5015]
MHAFECILCLGALALLGGVILGLLLVKNSTHKKDSSDV